MQLPVLSLPVKNYKVLVFSAQRISQWKLRVNSRPCIFQESRRLTISGIFALGFFGNKFVWVAGREKEEAFKLIVGIKKSYKGWLSIGGSVHIMEGMRSITSFGLLLSTESPGTLGSNGVNHSYYFPSGLCHKQWLSMDSVLGVLSSLRQGTLCCTRHEVTGMTEK